MVAVDYSVAQVVLTIRPWEMSTTIRACLNQAGSGCWLTFLGAHIVTKATWNEKGKGNSIQHGMKRDGTSPFGDWGLTFRVLGLGFKVFRVRVF